MPLVSVILPTFNRADMVLDAVKSVQAQTFHDWEIVVVDDGSKDNTQDVIASIQDERIRYIYQENKGLPGARNTGIRNSRGELIAFLDSDDAFLPNKLATQSAYLQTHPEVGLVAGGFFEVDRLLKPLRELRPWEVQPTLTLRDWVLGCPICPAAPLVRVDWLKKADLFDESMRYVEDWDLWLRLSHLGCLMDWTPDPVAYYRIHGGNMVRQAVMMKNGMITMFDKFFQQEGLSEEILGLKDLAYANAYLNGAARAYAAGDGDEGRSSLSMALRLNPAYLNGNPPQALGSLTSFALSPLCGNAQAFIEKLALALPPEAHNWSRGQLFGTLHAVAAFEANKHGRPKTIFSDMLAAIRYDPSWLGNRGLLAIAFRSLITRVGR